MIRIHRIERLDALQRGLCDARARIERGAEPLAVLVAVRRIAVSGSRLGQRDVPMWSINERQEFPT